MKSATRIAHLTISYDSVNPKPLLFSFFHSFNSSASILHQLPASLVSSLPGSRISTFCSLSVMAGGEDVAPPSSLGLEKQFEGFRVQLENSGSLRERIRAVLMEVESTCRIIQAGLLLVHQSRPIKEVLVRVNPQIGVLKELYSRLSEVLRESHGQYYRYHADWRGETQTVVSLLAFIHWLETGTLLMHSEAEEKLGLNSSNFIVDIEDYLVGICFMSNEIVRTGILFKLLFCTEYVVNRVTAGDYDCPRKVLNFMTQLHSWFRMLNLRNDFLRKKFDSLKYDVRKVEEVFYDVKIRGLISNEELVGKE